MPRTLKKVWPWILVVTVAVIACSSFWWQRASQAKASDQPVAQDQAATASQPTALITVEPGAPWVQPVVQRLGLSGECLIALNLSQDQARSLRQTVRSWCNSNKPELATAFGQAAAARETQLRPLATNLEAQVSAILTPAQVAAWRNLQQYTDLPIEYRLAAPSDTQRAKLKKLLQDRWYAGRAAKTETARQQVQSKFDTDLRATLSGSQMAAIEAYHTSSPAAAAAVMEQAQDGSGAATTDWQ